MVIRLITYSDPFSITSTASEELQEILNEFPHLCVSDTLAQGLRAVYNAGDVGAVFTLRDALEGFYKEWVMTANKVKRFLSVCEAIDSIDESAEKKASLRFDRLEVVSALEWLSFMKVTPGCLKRVPLTAEQNALSHVFEKVEGLKEWRLLEEAEISGKKRFAEVCFDLLKKRVENGKIASFEPKSEKQVLGKKKALQESKVLRDVHSQWEKNGGPSGVLVHGVHQFEPLMLRWFFHLDSLGLQIVLLHNKLPQFPEMYRTWEKVTEWIRKKTIDDKEDRSFDFNGTIGESFALLLQGKLQPLPSSTPGYYKFDSKSSFSSHIADVFERARSIARGANSIEPDIVTEQFAGAEPSNKNVLAKMEEHFYVPSNKKINDILRCYFPEQFGERHFLAYPIGQFVLGLYNMWDDQNKSLMPCDAKVRECLSVGWFDQKGSPSLNETYSKIQLYFKNIQNHNASEWVERFDVLIKNQEDIKSNNLFHRFSFYAVDLEEVKRLKNALQEIVDLSKRLFGGNDGELNFSMHFRTLLETLKKLAEDRVGERQEESVLNDLFSALEKLPQDITGTMNNLRETLHFYLNGSGQKSDSSRWIARNFEQLDGAVLLSKINKNSSKLHIGLLSNEQLLRHDDGQMPWPLDEKLLELLSLNNQEPEKMISHITLQSKKEYSNFLRFSIFYTLFFSKSPIVLSYVSDLGNEKEQTPYFLLEMLGLNISSRPSSPMKGCFVATGTKEPSVLAQRMDFSASEEDRQSLAYCPYRFFFSSLLQRFPFYENEWHCRYLYRVLFMSEIFQEMLKSRSLDDQLTKSKHAELKYYFPFWQETDFVDLYSHFNKKDKNSLYDNIKNYQYKKYNNFTKYLLLRQRFLVGKLSGKNNEQDNLINDLHHIRDTAKLNEREFKSLNIIRNNKFNMPENEKIKCRYCSENVLCLQGYGGSEY